MMTTSELQKRRFRPAVEQLECRAVPAMTTWKGGVDLIKPKDWGTAANWSNGLPDANKGANFDGGISQNPVEITVAVSCNSIQVQSNYNQGSITIKDNGTLTVTNGGDIESGPITQSGQSNFIEVSGGTLTWGGGAINPNGGTMSDLIIDRNATLTIQGTDTNQRLLGDELQNYGTVKYSATGGMLLGNGGGITNYLTGDFQVQNHAPVTISPVVGSTAYILNNGTFEKITDTGEASFALPLVNEGNLNLHAGTLTFTGSYTVTEFTNTYKVSVYNEGGTMALDKDTTLKGGARDGILQDAGTMEEVGNGIADFVGGTYVNGGTITFGGIGLGRLDFLTSLYINGTTTLVVYYDSPTSTTDQLNAVDIHIGNDPNITNQTVLHVEFVNGEPPAVWANIMTTQNGIAGDFATFHAYDDEGEVSFSHQKSGDSRDYAVSG
jgi:hypothetical protein